MQFMWRSVRFFHFIIVIIAATTDVHGQQIPYEFKNTSPKNKPLIEQRPGLFPQTPELLPSNPKILSDPINENIFLYERTRINLLEKKIDLLEKRLVELEARKK